MRRCMAEADIEHTDAQVLAAARALGAEHYLPEPEQLELLSADRTTNTPARPAA